ncbi:MAG: D-amino acid dehydrogenase [Noviherbaspirillum sp.]
MQVAVVGGGVNGVCTAYFLAEAGHEVVVLERYGNVAQETSFGNAGMVAPAHAAPWAAPGMPGKILSYLWKSEAPVLIKAKFDPALWRWMRRWLDECKLDRFLVNRARMQRLASYSQEVLRLLREHHNLDYERTSGVLQLFRGEPDLRMAQPALEWLQRCGMEHRLLDADAARALEPALSGETPLAAALHLPRDESGNCPQFTRQLKKIAQDMGVGFHFNTRVEAISPRNGRIDLTLGGQAFSADAVVLAAGSESQRLLRGSGISLPFYPVKGYCGTAVIKDFDAAPLAALADETYKVAITRMGSRIRIAGAAELGSRSSDLHAAALRTLIKVGEDWFPRATNFHSATFWCGARPMLPDGVPLLGATPVRNLYINIGDGASGWAMAAGAGKVLADLISGRSTDIDLDGLTMARYG